MNKVNDWKTTLNAANKALAKQGKVITLEEFDETYTIYIEDTATNEWEVYAEGYYEDELCDIINDAWSHACAKAKVKSETIYSEVKCTHHEDGFWVVDAWKTDDQNEEGQVIAVINDVTGDCYAIRNLNDEAKYVINKKQTEIVAQCPEILAEIYNSMTDAEKDEFLRMTENQ